MQRLSGLDAGFLVLETANAPMTIGGVSILDPRTDSGTLDVTAFRALLRRRLGRAVTLRRRLTSTGIVRGRPHWVEVAPEEIDLELHVERTELPEPGGWHELSELMAWQLAEPLPRDRPLWHFLFVEGVFLADLGVERGVALIGRAHHAAVDGISGAEILGVLFDGLEIATAAVPSSRSPAAAHVGGRLGKLTTRVTSGLMQSLRRAPQAVTESPRVSRILGRTLLGLGVGAVAGLRGGAPPLPYTAPRTALNRPISAQRAWSAAFLPLERVKAVKNAADATVNDVILAICAGALRDWLQARGELPQEPLVAMVPVSVRGAAERGAAGNQVSAMLVSLATDEADPQRRLTSIRDAARTAKLAHRALGARTLIESTELLPFALSGLAARLYTQLHLADHHRPIFNVVITNVPGPPRPLTVAGARLLAHVGAAPIFDGLGLILVVFSYAGMISIGVTADRAAMPEAADLATRLEAALPQLEAVASSLRGST